MHRTEPSRLQSLSLQLSDKIAQMVDNNERLLEFRGYQGGGGRGGWRGGDRGGGRGGWHGKLFLIFFIYLHQGAVVNGSKFKCHSVRIDMVQALPLKVTPVTVTHYSCSDSFLGLK